MPMRREVWPLLLDAGSLVEDGLAVVDGAVARLP